MDNQDLEVINIEISVPTQTPPKPSPPNNFSKSTVTVTFEGNTIEILILMPKGHNLHKEIFAFDL